ncbi:hypothetical protein RhiLY_06530 [Ceratobasidium sp. AG-Ba]|nr:hypothetical protein RhiLY_06530 [Ceratobasidium sp. AG-Ba]
MPTPCSPRCAVHIHRRFRHDSIPTAIQELQKWGPYWNISFDATEDPGKFTPANLAQYDAVILRRSRPKRLCRLPRKGGNFVGIHAASAGYLDKTATFVKEMQNNPATDACPDRWTFGEEVYSFTTDPRKTNGAKLLWSVDPSSYKVPDRVLKCREQHRCSSGHTASHCLGPRLQRRSCHGCQRRSRTFLLFALGHANGTWHDATFMKHVMGGLSWVFGSNTTRVATGLYGGAAPTVHTGSTNNATTGAAATWNAVLGSSQTAPPPPPPSLRLPRAAAHTEATGGSGTSGAVSVRSGMAWALVAALAGFVSL